MLVQKTAEKVGRKRVYLAANRVVDAAEDTKKS